MTYLQIVTTFSLSFYKSDYFTEICNSTNKSLWRKQKQQKNR